MLSFDLSMNEQLTGLVKETSNPRKSSDSKKEKWLM
jgi:hypothetical protein